MTASQGPQDWISQQAKFSGYRAVGSEMDWQTPALSEKFQSRFGRRPDSADTGLGSAHSESTEDFCCPSSSPSFQPIRTQICIPTAHVMPSTSGSVPCRSSPRVTDEPLPPAASKPASLPKSASSPNLEAEGRSHVGRVGGDCLSRYRSLVNGLDHSLLPPADGLGFDTPAVEPTLNQSAMMGSFCPEPRGQLHLSGSPLHPWQREQPSGSGLDPRWQQLEKLRLQVEQMQLLTAGSGQYSSLYPPSLPAEGGPWDAVVKASESLLKEKELVIGRQKQQMAQLEQRLRESELQVHGALLGHGAAYPDVCLLRLQEAQRENAFLRAQFAERTEGLAQEKAEAERRLAAEEAESRKLSDALREAGLKHSEEIRKQEERIRSRDKHISSLKRKCQKESEESRERQQRIETLERYLGDLPTQEDFQAQSKQAREQATRLQAQVLELEGSLREARTAAQERDAQLGELRERERDLLNTVTGLQQRVKEGLEDGARLPSLDVEALQQENSNLREELHRHRKLIDKQQKTMDQMRTQIGVLHAQALQEEGGVQALREELSGKEQDLLQLRQAMKELSAQNQELLEGKLSLQERLGSVESDCVGPPSPAVARLMQRLHGELSACFGDLRSLCNVLTQRAQGRDPNLSLLLGITSPPPGAEAIDDWLQEETLDRKLQEVQQLRHDVEELRTSVSDRYAQDMGDNCITQ
ncbi:hypothetical protein GJAV_G00009690 [Gymnothorax javanicus]|nr:hypothetical protein GJAV_G00009690 [Gymnothorax javanicus]